MYLVRLALLLFCAAYAVAGTPVDSWKAGYPAFMGEPVDMAVSPNLHYLAVYCREHLAFWDLHSGQYRVLDTSDIKASPTIDDFSTSKQLAFSPDSRYLALAGNPLKLFDLEEGSYRLLDAGATAVVFSADARLIGAGDRLLYWDPVTGTRLGKLSGDLRNSSHLTLSGDGRLAVAFPARNSITIGFWDWASKRPLYRHRFAEIKGFWLPQGDRAILQILDQTISLNLKTNEKKIEYIQEAKGVSPDGDTLITFTLPDDYDTHQSFVFQMVHLGGPKRVTQGDRRFYNKNYGPIYFIPNSRHMLMGGANTIYLADAAGQVQAMLAGNAEGCWYVRTPDGAIDGSGCKLDDLLAKYKDLKMTPGLLKTIPASVQPPPAH